MSSAAERGDAGAEGDEHLVVAVQEEFFGEFALQPGEGGGGVVERGVGEQDDELFAAVAGNGVLRAQGVAADAGEVDERFVAGLVAQAVVELFEVVDVEQGNAEGGFVPAGAGHFLAEYFFQPAPVEYAGELVVADEVAGGGEFVFQFLDAGFGFLHLLLGDAEFVARALGVDLDVAGFAHDFAEHGFEVGDVFGGADFCGAVFDLVVVIRGGVGEVGQVVDEAGEHVFDGVAGFGDAGLELGLLEEDFLEPALGVVQRMLGERFVDDVAHDLDLAVQPVVVENEFGRRCRPAGGAGRADCCEVRPGLRPAVRV